MTPNVCIHLPNAFDAIKYLISYYRGGLHRSFWTKRQAFSHKKFFDSLNLVVHLVCVFIKLPETLQGTLGKNTLKVPKLPSGKVPRVFGTGDPVPLFPQNNIQKIVEIVR